MDRDLRTLTQARRTRGESAVVPFRHIVLIWNPTNCLHMGYSPPGTSALAMGNDCTNTALCIQQGTILRNKLALDGKYKNTTIKKVSFEETFIPFKGLHCVCGSDMWLCLEEKAISTLISMMCSGSHSKARHISIPKFPST